MSNFTGFMGFRFIRISRQRWQPERGLASLLVFGGPRQNGSLYRYYLRLASRNRTDPYIVMYVNCYPNQRFGQFIIAALRMTPEALDKMRLWIIDALRMTPKA